MNRCRYCSYLIEGFDEFDAIFTKDNVFCSERCFDDYRLEMNVEFLKTRLFDVLNENEELRKEISILKSIIRGEFNV